MTIKNFSYLTLFSSIVGRENAQKPVFGSAGFFLFPKLFNMKKMLLCCLSLAACGHSEPIIQSENTDRHIKLTCLSVQPILINTDDAPAIWLLELDSSEYIICSETYANSIVKHK